MTNFTKPPTWADKTHVLTVIETPRGSHCKLEFDPNLRVFTLAKPLLAGLTLTIGASFHQPKLMMAIHLMFSSSTMRRPIPV
jgi:hypothetical protein